MVAVSDRDWVSIAITVLDTAAPQGNSSMNYFNDVFQSHAGAIRTCLLCGVSLYVHLLSTFR